MILSGQIFTADQLIAAAWWTSDRRRRGRGDALEQFVRSVEPRLRGTIAALRLEDSLPRLAYESLQTVVDLGQYGNVADRCATCDLMERLARAQVRKIGGAEIGAVEEIKRMELDTAWGFEKTGMSEWSTL